MWQNTEAMRLGTDIFTAESLEVRVDSQGQFAYVGLYFQLVNMTAGMRIWCHITLISRGVGSYVFTTDQMRRFESIASSILQGRLFPMGTFAGDVVPLHSAGGDPHRLLLFVHVQSRTASRLWALRRDIWSTARSPGETGRRVGFHLSVDMADGDVEN